MGGQSTAGASRHQEEGGRQMARSNHSQEIRGKRDSPVSSGLRGFDFNWRALALSVQGAVITGG